MEESTEKVMILYDNIKGISTVNETTKKENYPKVSVINLLKNIYIKVIIFHPLILLLIAEKCKLGIKFNSCH